MLATADQLVAALGLSRSNPKQVGFCLLADTAAPIADRLIKKYVGYQIEEGSFTEYHPLISSRPTLSQGFVEDDMILAYEGSLQGARPIRQGRGNARDTLSLYNLPIRSIVDIRESPDAWLHLDEPNGFFPDSTKLLSSRDYQVDWDGTDYFGSNICKSGFVFRIGSVWLLQARSVKVSYNAGYTAKELEYHYVEFRAAALLTGVFLFRQLTSLGVGQGNGSGFGSSGIKIAEAMDDYSVKYAPPGQLPALLMDDIPAAARALIAKDIRYSQYI